MTRARWIALAAVLCATQGCAPKPVERPPEVSAPMPAPTSPPAPAQAVRIRGRILSTAGALTIEPCDGSAAVPLSGDTRLLEELLPELGGGDAAGASMFGVLELAGSGAGQEIVVIHAAPEGRGCDIDWAAFTARAIGNEPFWSIDVLASSLLLRRPEHADRVVPAEGSLEGIPGILEARDAGGAMRLELTPVPCRDSMSGAYLEMTATATVDGETLHGCALRGHPPGR